MSYNALGQLTDIISKKETSHLLSSLSPYGPQALPRTLELNLLKVAASLNWHSYAQDPTGLIWMGERYYNPRSGRFLSPDSFGYSFCLNLYTYANGDPVNYIDPDGRFATRAYETIEATVVNTLNNPAFKEGCKLLGD